MTQAIPVQLLTPPEKPKPGDCCGGGCCCPCVWDAYRAARKVWLENNPESEPKSEKAPT